MSETNGEANEFDEGVKSNQEEAAPTAVSEAVQKALSENNITQVQLAPCPCGTPNVNLLIDLPQGSKVGRAGCSACGVWGVDFLAPRTQDQEILGSATAKAWNEAPRGL